MEFILLMPFIIFAFLGFLVAIDDFIAWLTKNS